MRLPFIVLLLLCVGRMAGQSAAITIDGRFDDWDASLVGIVDAPENFSGIDILSMQVTNDADHLFIHIELDTEIDLADDDFPQEMFLYLDTDNDASTGFPAQAGYGSEFGIDLSDRSAFFNVAGQSVVDLHDIGYTQAPTVTGTEFELAIARNALPDGFNPLFSGNTIKILLRELSGGDELPNVGATFSYTFSNTPVPFTPLNTSKSSPNDVRVVAYNTEQDGLLSSVNLPHLQAVITALDADVYGFSECYYTTAANVKNLLDQWVPTGTTNGWYVLKDDFELISASRWPFLNSWPNVTRQFPALIDLPASYDTDLLFTNAHLNCCANDNARQAQVDEYAAFILDAKTAGGQIDLPLNTPFVYGGDLNFVGFQAQLNTLLTGQISNTIFWGQGGPLDWDNTEVTDIIPRHTHDIETFTWQNLGSSYPPGRLDLMMYSDAVMELANNFVLRTESMPMAALNALGLSANDTEDASDHFPLVADFKINEERVSLWLSVFLGGPFNGVDMNDDLRAQGLIPLEEPYTALGYTHVGGGGEIADANVFTVTGSNAIVDWVFVELRDANDSSIVLATRSALLQRDGNVVDIDGVSPLEFSIEPAHYFVSVKHRNHLGVLTQNTYPLSGNALAVNMSNGTVPLQGTLPIDDRGGIQMLWSGDATGEGSVKYTGSGNDRDFILQQIGGSIPTVALPASYMNTDLNLDGVVKYVGVNNDRDIVLINVGGNVPTATRIQQIP